jgi:formylglycine-generating enzyme
MEIKMKKTVVIIILGILLFSACDIFKPKLEEHVEMILMEGGTFSMGDVWGDGYTDELPVHDVTLSSFYIGKYQVTQKLYQEVMGNNPSYFIGDSLPVERVSWYDAVAFCNALSDTTGLEAVYTIDSLIVTADFTKNGYRLPTEAEWEYAARSGGRDDRKWSGTNTESDLGDYAWYRDNSYSLGSDHPNYGTNEVGTKLSNELGIYDMSGNVIEWCWDWYGDYTSSSQTNPTGPSTGSYRVRRGGSWYDYSGYCRTADRYSSTPAYSYSYLGFRLARNAE